jgi:hypothetical protein
MKLSGKERKLRGKRKKIERLNAGNGKGSDTGLTGNITGVINGGR